MCDKNGLIFFQKKNGTKNTKIRLYLVYLQWIFLYNHHHADKGSIEIFCDWFRYTHICDMCNFLFVCLSEFFALSTSVCVFVCFISYECGGGSKSKKRKKPFEYILKFKWRAVFCFSFGLYKSVFFCVCVCI